MSKLLKFLISLVIGILIFGVMMKIVGWKTIPQALTFFLSFKGLIIFSLIFLSMTLSTIKWKFVLETITGRTDFKGLGGVWFAGFAVTFLSFLVVGGEPFRIFLIKKKYGLDWKKSSASVLIERFLDWTVFLVFIIIGLFIFLFYNHMTATKMIIFSFLAVCFLLGLLILFYFKALRKESFLRHLLKIFGIKKEKLENSNSQNIIFEVEKEMINFLSPKKKVFWQGLFLAFLKYLLTFTASVFLVFSLSGCLNIFKNLVIFGFNDLANLFPVPAALGSLEAASIISFEAVGLSAALGGVFAMVFRGANLLNALIGVFFFLQFSAKSASEKIFEFVDKIKEE